MKNKNTNLEAINFFLKIFGENQLIQFLNSEMEEFNLSDPFGRIKMDESYNYYLETYETYEQAIGV